MPRKRDQLDILTEAEEIDVAAGYREGQTVRELAENFFVSQYSVRKALALQGVELRPRGRKGGGES